MRFLDGRVLVCEPLMTGSFFRLSFFSLFFLIQTTKPRQGIIPNANNRFISFQVASPPAPQILTRELQAYNIRAGVSVIE